MANGLDEATIRKICDDLTPNDETPKCTTCNAPCTTGLMAAFCPAGRKCEFWVPEMEDFMCDMGMTPPPATQEDDHA